MWRIYSPDQLGVRIKTTVPELKKQLKTFRINKKGSKTRVSLVKYMRQSALNIEMKKIAKNLKENYTPYKAISSLFFKRNAFNHEAELRAVLYNQNTSNSHDYLRVSINPHKLIKSVLFDPRLSDELVSVYKYYLKEKFKYRGSIKRSQLYKQVKQIPVGQDEG